MIIDVPNHIFNRHKIIRLAKFSPSQNTDLWKIFFANREIKIAKLLGDSYRSRWWIVLNFSTLDKHQHYSIVMPRFYYPIEVFRKLSAYLWYYV